MTTGPSQSAAAEAKRRWYRLTPDRLVWLVLVIEGLLWLAERFGCFPKGYAVLLAVASVAAAMLVMLLWFAASLVFRWRFQFSVGSLMVLAVVVATLCGWFGVEKKEATEQKEAVAGIEKLKGFVSYDYMGDSGEWRGRARLRGLLGDDFSGKSFTPTYTTTPRRHTSRVWRTSRRSSFGTLRVTAWRTSRRYRGSKSWNYLARRSRAIT